MKITKERLKQIIKEELTTLEEDAPKEGLSVEGVSEEQRVGILKLLLPFTRDSAGGHANLRKAVFDVVVGHGTGLDFLSYAGAVGPDKVRQVLINKRDETAPGDATVKPYLDKEEGEKPMPLEEQLKQMIKEELENVMGEAATTDDEHMAEMVYAIARDKGILDKLRRLEDGEKFEDAVESLMGDAVGSGEESPYDVAPIVRQLLNGETL
jgi:hypothetical protein